MCHNQDAKARMLKAAAELLEEHSDIDKITVRQIADRAVVGVGSISYHFGSKDCLLAEVTEEMFTRLAQQYTEKAQTMYSQPLERLKATLKFLFRLIPDNEKLVQFMLRQDILRGDIKIPLLLIPTLKDLFGVQKEELELRILALQIIQPLQTAMISPNAFRIYSGVDIYQEQERNQYIDKLVNNLTEKGKLQ